MNDDIKTILAQGEISSEQENEIALQYIWEHFDDEVWDQDLWLLLDLVESFEQMYYDF